MINQKKVTSVAVIGAGPTGCMLSCLLAQRGVECVIFDDNKRPSFLVGESLLPASIPLLRKIGVEAEVAKISQLKPGACFRHENGFRVDITFNKQGPRAPNYAYNIPRPQFDDILKKRAQSLGVKIVSSRAKLVLGEYSTGAEIRLSEESLKIAGFEHSSPDVVVDASGRKRVISRFLSLPTLRSKRDDVAYFAHYRDFDSDASFNGQIVISVLDKGWSWQIPLKDSLSVGIVLNKAAATSLGSSPEDRLESAINASPLLKMAGKYRDRVSPVMSYANYPIISQRASGKGWVLAGDALGFTDPMLSPGVFMGLKSAEVLDKCLSGTSDYRGAMEKYSNQMYGWHEAWNELIEYFYDGRLLALSEQGKALSAEKSMLSMHNLTQRLTKSFISSLVSGASTRSKTKRFFVNNACKAVVKGCKDSERFAVQR